MVERQLVRALHEIVGRDIPTDLDLWPALSRQLAARRTGANGASCLPRIKVIESSCRLSLFAGVAILLLLVIAVTGLPLGSRPVAPASAAEVLETLAEVAAAQPAESGTAPGYRYTKSDTASLSTFVLKDSAPFSVIVPKTREIWVRADGAGRLRETAGEPIFLGERDRARWQAAGSPDVVSAINEGFGPGKLSYEDFSRLPADPKALADVIRQRATETAGPPINAEMFVIVGDLLRETVAPPELRSALFKVATGIEGVELVGDTSDRAGRSGIGVAVTTSYSGAKERKVLIFDRTTSALLGEETVLLERGDWVDAQPPAVIGYSTYLASEIVEKLP